MNNNYPFAPLNHSLTDNYLNKLKLTINLLMNGKMNNTGEVTLTPNASSTTVTDNLCNENSVILFTPVTSNAAQHTQTAYIVAGDKEFTIHHNSSANTDKTIRYVIIG